MLDLTIGIRAKVTSLIISGTIVEGKIVVSDITCLFDGGQVSQVTIESSWVTTFL